MLPRSPATRLQALSRPRRRGVTSCECDESYRVHAVLGSGGMATVYLATTGARLGNRRFCALKVLHDKLNEQGHYSSMFLNEARIASEIAHPHVCGVFDYGCINGQAYLAMDFVQGKSLADLGQACAKSDDPVEHARLVARVLADTCERAQRHSRVRHHRRRAAERRASRHQSGQPHLGLRRLRQGDRLWLGQGGEPRREDAVWYSER